MGISDSIIGEVAEKVTELGGHVAKQTGKAATDIAKGVVTGVTQTGTPTKPDQEFVEALYGKSAQQQSISDKQKKAATPSPIDPSTQQKMAQVRQNLKTMMTSPQVVKQELPAYIKGKPGGSQEDIQKKQVDFEKQKKKLPPLPVTARAGMGTGETHRGVAG